MIVMMDQWVVIDTDKKTDENGSLFTSLPTGIPLPKPAVSPTTLATKALRVRYSFSTTPLRMVFSSGIPEPVEEKQREERWTSRLDICSERC